MSRRTGSALAIRAAPPRGVRDEEISCAICGVPVDSQMFDDSTIEELPEQRREVTLARFELPPQYCGILEFFAQYFEPRGSTAHPLRTPELTWRLQVDGRPLFPYTALKHIVNPWGEGCFPVVIRLPERARVEFIVRNDELVLPANDLPLVGGRIVGRYWYNPQFGDAQRRP